MSKPKDRIRISAAATATALGIVAFLPVAQADGRHVSNLIARCHLVEQARPVELTYWKNEGYGVGRDAEGVHLRSSDAVKPEIGLAIWNRLGRLKLRNTEDQFEVSRMDFGFGSMLRGRISIDKRSGKGKIRYRNTICDFKGCETTERNEQLEGCTVVDSLQ